MQSADYELKQGQTVHGFEVTRVTELPNLQSTAYELHHPPSGARLLHIHNSDAENLFSISFPTPPPDNSGVPHILEHSVLAGSERFPVKEPFFEMIKMSMATFINAMTGPDCTYYPVASNVKRDLFNLADVYFDAVFHPLLSGTTFRREAHHLAPSDPGAPTGALTVNGIVYNEMKGAFSNPEACLYRAQSRGLFPDTIYGLESGGDPVAIPDLTREEMLTFHRSNYHPSNARFFLYGDVPTHDHLAFLEPRLEAFDVAAAHPPAARQPAWDTPRALADTYPVGHDESLEEKTYLVTSWRCYDAADPVATVLMRVMELVLVGNEGAPLRKALIDSNLGVDLVLTHADTMGCEGTFSVGLKGSEPDRLAAFEQCVMATLTSIADAGIEPDAIDAAFQQASYQYLEIQSLFPLHVMDNVLQSWLYGNDPLPFVSMQQHLQTCREQHHADPRLFSTMIREQLIENQHRLTVTLSPDPDHEARAHAAFEARMRETRAGMSDDDARQIAADAAELDHENSLPNTPEQIASLPQLAISDLPADLVHIPTTVESAGPITLLRNEVPANGVNTLMLDFNLQGLPEALWPRLPRYAEAISKMGAAGMGYEVIAHRKAASTGGIGCIPLLMTHATREGEPVWGLRVTLKTLDDRIGPALGLLHDILFGVDPRNRERLHDVLSQMRAHCRTAMVHNGSGTAATHAGRGLSIEDHLEEVLHGLPQLDQAEALAGRFDEECETVMADVETIRDLLLNRDRLTASFTGSPAVFTAVQAALCDWAGQMAEGLPAPAPTGFVPYDVPPREGLAGPIQVAHCALAIPAPHFSHPDEPLLAVGSHLVRMEYILSEIRFKGNAYGAHFNHSPFHGRISMGSFNDPHITRTLDVFAKTQAFVEAAQWTQTDVDRAIIATAKDMTRPIRPAAATRDALMRHLAGITHDVREHRYAQMRSVTPTEARRALLEALDAGLPRAAICVVSSREKLEAANTECPTNPLAIRDILRQ
ncbi:MAG: insulinase family protein [Kiritimatiellae bacterium]|nr:insulinase family protein [Kiritimatiellia bacterium]